MLSGVKATDHGRKAYERMTLLAAFIGIDRFADPIIRELSGCRRDALALWSLFSDTVPDLRAELLIDDQATSGAIRAAFDATLGAANSDDVVILSFSGHGTPDHRLVTHDSDRTHYSDTAIDMAELATRFKQSRARAVLCILDCCFSGGPQRAFWMTLRQPDRQAFPLIPS